MDNDFVEGETGEADAELEKRQDLKIKKVRIGNKENWRGDSGWRNVCFPDFGGETYAGDTGPNAPYTGGPNAIINVCYLPTFFSPYKEALPRVHLTSHYAA